MIHRTRGRTPWREALPPREPASVLEVTLFLEAAKLAVIEYLRSDSNPERLPLDLLMQVAQSHGAYGPRLRSQLGLGALYVIAHLNSQREAQ